MSNPITKHPRLGDSSVTVDDAIPAASVTTAMLAANAVTAAKTDISLMQTASIALTNAEIKALRATPKVLVAAGGANTFLEFVSATLVLHAGANVLTESTANLAVKYKDGTGTQVSETVECTGFIDQAVDTLTTVRVKQDAIVATSIYTNQPLVLHNLGAGEFGGNAAADATMTVKIAWRVRGTT